MLNNATLDVIGFLQKSFALAANITHRWHSHVNDTATGKIFKIFRYLVEPGAYILAEGDGAIATKSCSASKDKLMPIL